jgi:hypothetical protein
MTAGDQLSEATQLTLRSKGLGSHPLYAFCVFERLCPQIFHFIHKLLEFANVFFL